MQNIEIKTAVPDLERVESRITAMNAEYQWTHRQRDTFFNVRSGYLKLRVVEGEPSELIAYVREAGTLPRPSDYEVVRIAHAAELESALSRSLGIRGMVEKTRRLFVWRHTRIHLDEVKNLGQFLELETVASGINLQEARREADLVIDALGLSPTDFLDRPYLELLETRAVPAP
jgi:predicted adenylyl cyclase CyaB